jgi:hypothetical protein
MFAYFTISVKPKVSQDLLENNFIFILLSSNLLAVKTSLDGVNFYSFKKPMKNAGNGMK